jgi:hypothetical protein
MVKIYAPSYRRPQKSITQKHFPYVKLVVCESEKDQYIANGNDVVVCPDSAQGNVSRVRNWILDNLFDDDTECIVIIDDDCGGIGYFRGTQKNRFRADQLMEWMELQSRLCKELGFYHWGVNCVPDKGAYHEHKPMGWKQYIGSPFSGHLKGSECRYDENLSLKEDYDMTLQHLQRYGGVLRLNYVYYEVKQAEQIGGCATYRNLKEEKRQFWELQRKWGKDIVQRDKKSKRSFDFNPVLKIPIKGV